MKLTVTELREELQRIEAAGNGHLYVVNGIHERSLNSIYIVTPDSDRNDGAKKVVKIYFEARERPE